MVSSFGNCVHILQIKLRFSNKMFWASTFSISFMGINKHKIIPRSPLNHFTIKACLAWKILFSLCFIQFLNKQKFLFFLKSNSNRFQWKCLHNQHNLTKNCVTIIQSMFPKKKINHYSDWQPMARTSTYTYDFFGVGIYHMENISYYFN